jgi:hypothetical protein
MENERVQATYLRLRVVEPWCGVWGASGHRVADLLATGADGYEALIAADGQFRQRHAYYQDRHIRR